MKRFVKLFEDLDATQSTLRKLEVMASYFREAPPEDAVWALYYLSGRKQKRLLSRAVIQTAVQELSGLSEWLFSESYQVVGDLAETVALLCPPQTGSMDDQPLHIWIEKRLPELARSAEPRRF